MPISKETGAIEKPVKVDIRSDTILKFYNSGSAHCYTVGGGVTILYAGVGAAGTVSSVLYTSITGVNSGSDFWYAYSSNPLISQTLTTGYGTGAYSQVEQSIYVAGNTLIAIVMNITGDITAEAHSFLRYNY